MVDNQWIASSDGDLERVRAFLARRARASTRAENVLHVLHAATSYIRVALLATPIRGERGRRAARPDGDTPLHVRVERCPRARMLAAGATFGERRRADAARRRARGRRAMNGVSSSCASRDTAAPAAAGRGRAARGRRDRDAATAAAIRGRDSEPRRPRRPPPSPPPPPLPEHAEAAALVEQLESGMHVEMNIPGIVGPVRVHMGEAADDAADAMEEDDGVEVQQPAACDDSVP